MVTVARRVRAWRESVGLSIPEFADRLGYTSPAVYQWESGKTSPGRESIAKIAKVCGITLPEFWGALPRKRAA